MVILAGRKNRAATQEQQQFPSANISHPNHLICKNYCNKAHERLEKGEINASVR
jgi:hypothetical protein